MNDAQIIARILAGETDAYRLLVAKYHRPVFALVTGLVRNSTDVEDLAQEVFVAAFTHLDSFDIRRAKFGTWLLTIARNRCCNHLKRRPVQNSNPDDWISGIPAPDLDASNRETWMRLDAALECLSIEQRTAFILAELQEIPLAEIAAIEGVPLGTVKSRVSRAKERLRQVLKDLRPDGCGSEASQTARSFP